MIYRINDKVTKFLMAFSALWAFGLAFYILADVLARNLNMPIEGTAEIAREMAQLSPDSSLDELQRQNKELLHMSDTLTAMGVEDLPLAVACLQELGIAEFTA